MQNKNMHWSAYLHNHFQLLFLCEFCKWETLYGYGILMWEKEMLYVVRAMQFGMKLYNVQCNAHVFSVSIYLCLTCFGLSFSPSLEAGVQFWQWLKSPGYGVSVPHVLGFLLVHL
jgi:hypothetical protein